MNGTETWDRTSQIHRRVPSPAEAWLILRKFTFEVKLCLVPRIAFPPLPLPRFYRVFYRLHTVLLQSLFVPCDLQILFSTTQPV